MMPYRKMSVNTAMHIVVRMKIFEDRSLSRYGGGELGSTRAPEMKFVTRPMVSKNEGFFRPISQFWPYFGCFWSPSLLWDLQNEVIYHDILKNT